VVAETPEEAYLNAISDFGLSASELTKEDLRQDEDVMDTWFSSWLWPFEVFHGLSNPGNDDLRYYYPTTTLVTAPEIIFFWVARMIMAGFEYMHEKPFSNVYFTGIVRDKQGRKMSKSLGNSPDLLELIEQYGADAVRFGILISSPAGNDLLFDEKLIEQGRNFNNKIWNALRLVKGWKVSANNPQPATDSRFAVEWFESKLNASLAEVEKLLDDFQISAALKVLYSLVWDDFCSWYLEMVKPEYEQPVDTNTRDATIDFFEQLMKLLHPFFPFITEEVYHLLHDRKEDEFIMVADYPVSRTANTSLLAEGDKLKALITSIRDLRNRNQIRPKERLRLFVLNPPGEQSASILKKLAGLSSIEKTEGNPEKTLAFLVGAEHFFLESPLAIDAADERLRLEKDLEYHRGFLESVMKKLSNQKFVANARPDVIEKEQKKASDARDKIRLIEEQLAAIAQPH
jgi:valyl-tRNA synthetase